MSTNSFRGTTRRLALTLCLLLCGAQHASAQQQIRYPQLLTHGGKQFAAYVNEINGTPTWIIDTDSLDFTLGSPTTLSSESAVRVASDAFVEDAKDLFGVDPKKLEGPTISKSAEVWLISYQQVFSNLRVLGAKLGLTVTRQGRLLAAGARLFPKVNVDTTPSLSAEAAMQAATGHASIPDPDVSAKDELVILAIEEDGAYVYGLAWEITVSNLNVKPPRSKTFLVDAHSGKILHEYDNISHGGHVALAGHDQPSSTGEAEWQAAPPEGDTVVATETECPDVYDATEGIKGRITLNYYRSPDESTHALHREYYAGFPYAKYSVSGGSPSYSCEGYADANGNYSMTLPREGNYTITFYIANDSTLVNRWTGTTLSRDCLEKQSFTINVDRPVHLGYHWDWGISGDGGLSSFGLNGVFNARAMKEYFWNTHGTDWPNEAIQLVVGSENEAEVISHDDPPIASIGGAAAMSNEVIMHEYSHFIVDELVRTIVTSTEADNYAALKEASADYFATHATHNALFSGPNPGYDVALDAADEDLLGYIRDLDNECTMEGDCLSPQSLPGTAFYQYDLSRTLSGAIWSLHGEIGAQQATSMFYGALAMDPDPKNFETVADYMHRLASNTEKSSVEEVFADRGIRGPNNPADLIVTCVSNKPVLTWTDESSIEEGHEIERQTDGGSWQLIERIEPNLERFEDTTASCETTPQSAYVYQVAAFSTFGATNASTLRSYSAEAHYPPESGRSQARVSKLVVPEEVQSEKPAKLDTELRTVYPNPFNPVTTISYALKEAEHVNLVVYDVLGRRVAVLVDGVQAAGEYKIAFDASWLPSGSYFVRMETSAYSQNRMLVLAK